MLGCTPHSENEETVKSKDPQEYDDWLAEYKEDEMLEKENE